ncbi:MAG: cytochrome P450 [Alphaproteobacteria bacterium]|nr:cytochrome P450 [Alphaproteobacteria bacterium]
MGEASLKVGGNAPVSNIDPFSTAYFDDPYPFQEELREAGPAVWLSRYNVWAVARFEHVRAMLFDWKTYCSGRGVGLADFAKETPWRPRSILLEADPPQHGRARTILNRVLSPVAMKDLQDRFARAADDLVDTLLERGTFDGIADLAEAYPLSVFPDALGMPRENRHFLLPYGNMVFNAFGPRNELFHKSVENAAPVLDWLAGQMQRDQLAPQGFGAEIHAAVDTGEITAEEAPLIVRSLLTAGVDTTVNGIGAALYCLARFPEQWDHLRADPSLARAAFEEAVRFESPVQTFFRTTTRAVRIGDVDIDEGQKILMFLGAANRDPRHWEQPDQYDITRRTVGHVGFGAGIHMCVGQMLARLEGEVVLAALTRKVSRIEIVDEPQRRYNNTLRGLAKLPIRLQPIH